MPTRIAHKTCPCCHAPYNYGPCVVGYTCRCALHICYRCNKCVGCCPCPQGPEEWEDFYARMKKTLERRSYYAW